MGASQQQPQRLPYSSPLRHCDISGRGDGGLLGLLRCRKGLGEMHHPAQAEHALGVRWAVTEHGQFIAVQIAEIGPVKSVRIAAANAGFALASAA